MLLWIFVIHNLSLYTVYQASHVGFRSRQAYELKHVTDIVLQVELRYFRLYHSESRGTSEVLGPLSSWPHEFCLRRYFHRQTLLLIFTWNVFKCSGIVVSSPRSAHVNVTAKHFRNDMTQVTRRETLELSDDNRLLIDDDWSREIWKRVLFSMFKKIHFKSV